MSEIRLNVDIVDMLQFLGVSQIEKDGKEIWFQCPFPGHKPGSGNRNASFRRSAKQEGQWVFNCFVCGNKGYAHEFWALHQGIHPKLAKIALKERYGSAFIDPGAGDEVLREINRLLGEEDERDRPPVPLDERHVTERGVDWQGVWDAILADKEVPPALSYMFERGFMVDTLVAHDIGYDPVTEMISIPYRDAEHRCVAFKGRAWWDNARPKYRMLGNKPGKEDRYEFDTCDISFLLYGVWNLPPGDRLILCEGELNCMALRQYGHGRVLGLSGQFLHEKQVPILTGNANEVVLLFDEEEKAERAARMIEKKVRALIVPEHDGDPADSSDEEVASWLDDAYGSNLLD